MAQYQATYRLVNTNNGATIRQEQFSFNAQNVSDSIKRAETQRTWRNEYFHRNGNVFTLKLRYLQVFGSGHIGNPKYDPAADICDDCYRPFWKGHNFNVEH
jgi:hypothetical protein